MRDFEDYLARIRAALRVDPRRAEEICGELRSHLEAEVEELRRTGLSREDAAASATQSLGEAETIAQELARANYQHRMGGHEMAKRLAVWTAVALLVVWSTAFVRHQDQLEKRDWAPLHYAVLNGRTDEVKTLLAKGADVNVTPADGHTPLELAASKGNVEIAECLLAHGADVNAESDSHETALSLAALADSPEVVKLLLARGAHVNVINEDWETPLRLAASEGHTEVVELLLARGANPNKRDKFGWTPLHSAAMRGDVRMTRALLAAGAWVHAKTVREGRVTPLQLAKTEQVKELLRKHGGTL